MSSSFFKRLTRTQQSIVEDLSKGSVIIMIGNDNGSHVAIIKHAAHHGNYNAPYQYPNSISKCSVMSICKKFGSRDWLKFGSTDVEFIGSVKIKDFTW